MGGRRRRRGRVHPKEGVHYTGLWFNVNGLNRALVFRNKADDVRLDRLDCVGSVYAEEPAPQHAENIEAMKKQTALISKTMSRCRGSA